VGLGRERAELAHLPEHQQQPPAPGVRQLPRISDHLMALASAIVDNIDPRTRVSIAEELHAHAMLLMQQGVTKKHVATEMTKMGVMLLAEDSGQEEVSESWRLRL